MNEEADNSLQVSQNNENEENAEKCMEVETFGTPIIDESHIYKITRMFLRIEYPGFVKNVDKAVETLGGTYNIEVAMADPKKKMELRFHPDNKYNKPCVSDRDSNPGLVLEVTKKGEKIDFNILGYTYLSFKFNKAADFQFLPLTQDEKTDKIDYIYENIFPTKLPTLDFLVSKESSSQTVFLLPSNFSRYDISHKTLYLNADEKFNIEKNKRPELFRVFGHKKPKSKYPYRQISYLMSINDNQDIPTKPKPLAMKLVKDRFLDESYKKVKKLFDERPLWSKAAVQHKTGITNESAKVVLPAIAYFWFNGPFRMIWTKLGVDPRQDFNLRIYQTLDFRVRTSKGINIKIKAKRKYVFDTPCYTPSVPLSKTFLDESHYILSPELIPPARQMFYQYCDIKIPEIQDMLQRLPRTPGTQKFDQKTGWLPTNFAEQCREIASRCVLELVHQELIKDSLSSQSNRRTSTDKDSDDESVDQENPLSYSSSMLDKMKKGFRRNLDNSEETNENTVVLTDDESDDEIDQVDMEDIPARIDENSDAERPSDDSEMELDMEAVEEINQLISFSQKSLEDEEK